ncbi:hypothetical protein LEMLEM_LOCUS6267 [Lemmus lemmus]
MRVPGTEPRSSGSSKLFNYCAWSVSFISTGIRASGQLAHLFVFFLNLKSSIGHWKESVCIFKCQLLHPAREDTAQQDCKTAWEVTRKLPSPSRAYALDVCAELLLPKGRYSGTTGMLNYTSVV